MRRISTWAFGILVGSLLGYISWNAFMTPNFLMGETDRVLGKVIEVYPSREVQSYSRRIKYVYAVDDKYYFDFKKLGTEDKRQVIGNDLKIVYSINKPKRHRIEKHLNNYRNSKGEKYYSNKEKGYIKMDLINGIFKYKEFVDGGEIVKNFVGEYAIVKDSLQFKHYSFNANVGVNNNPHFFVVDANNRRCLIESDTKQVFKKIMKR